MKKMQIITIVLSTFLLIGVVGNVYAAEIGNTVWNDANKNGVQDDGEEGISGVRIKLYNGNDVKTEKTNSKGHYKFEDLDAGHYTLIVARETLPAGCVATYDRDGGKDGKYSDKYLKIDDEYTHADFGYYCPIKATYTSTTLKQVSPKTGTETSMASGISALIAALVAFVVYKRQIFVAKK